GVRRAHSPGAHLQLAVEGIEPHRAPGVVVGELGGGDRVTAGPGAVATVHGVKGSDTPRVPGGPRFPTAGCRPPTSGRRQTVIKPHHAGPTLDHKVSYAHNRTYDTVVISQAHVPLPRVAPGNAGWWRAGTRPPPVAAWRR